MSTTTMMMNKKREKEAGSATTTAKRDWTLPPEDFRPSKFKSTPLERDEAQSDENELWLFQFPPQVTTEDFAKSGLTIPTQTKMTAAGKHVYIGNFSVNSIKYNLHEAPSDSVSNMVNFWPNDETKNDGLVFRGKPFTRLFVATVDVAHNLTGQRQVIDRMPMGFNKPFEAKPILLPVGLDNPWFGEKPNGKPKNENIVKQLANSPFTFTSGDYDLTQAEDAKWLSDDTKSTTTTTTTQTKTTPTTKKQSEAKKSDVMIEVKAAPTMKQGKQEQQQSQQVAIKSEPAQKESKKSKKSRTADAVLDNDNQDDTVIKVAKKQKTQNDAKNVDDAQQLVKLDALPPSKDNKKSRKSKQ